MFEKVAKKASKSSSKGSTSRNSQEMPRTRAFVQALVNNNTRISYAGLASAAELLGEHTPSGLSAGQRGSQLVKGLPTALQPHVCRSNGGYAKGTEWDCEVPSDLKRRDYIKPNAVPAYVQAFIDATDASEEPEAEAEPEAELEADLEADFEGAPFDPETGEPQS